MEKEEQKEQKNLKSEQKEIGKDYMREHERGGGDITEKTEDQEE